MAAMTVFDTAMTRAPAAWSAATSASDPSACPPRATVTAAVETGTPDCRASSTRRAPSSSRRPALRPWAAARNALTIGL